MARRVLVATARQAQRMGVGPRLGRGNQLASASCGPTPMRCGSCAPPPPRPLRFSTSTATRAGAARPAVRAARTVATSIGLCFGMLFAGSASYLGMLRILDPDLFETVVRLVRLGMVASRITLDYVRVLDAEKDNGGAGDTSSAKVLSSAHHRNAIRLRDLCFANGGIYIKIGQHIGLLDYLLPDEYVSVMRAGCFDKAPISPWSDVARTIEEDLGAPPDELFAYFSPEPLASGSLAQVHEARSIESGQRLAVKVQHRALHRMARTEIVAIEAIMHAACHFFPQVDLQWLIDEAKLNLPQELDFVHEAANAERARAETVEFGNGVVVPRLHPEHSSRRVLTMDFETGCDCSDRKTIEKLGLRARDVAHLMAEVFGHMVFVKGFVHCDPHPGNVLVRALPNGKPQLVLLDHGLYREIEHDVRLNYCHLWKSIVLADANGIKEASDAMCIRSEYMERLYPGMSHTLMAAMLTQRGWDKVIDSDMGSLEQPPPASALHDAATIDDRDVSAAITGATATAAVDGACRDLASSQAIETAQEHADELRSNVAEYLPGILEILRTVPRSLLLMLKTNDCLRSHAFRLGARATETYIVSARCCLDSLSKPDALPEAAQASWWIRLQYYSEIYHARFRIWCYVKFYSR